MKEDLPHNEECLERVAGNDRPNRPNNRVWFDVEPERNEPADINAGFVLNIVFQNRRAAEQAHVNRAQHHNENGQDANNNDHAAVEERDEEEEEPRDSEENDQDGDGRGRVPDNN